MDDMTTLLMEREAFLEDSLIVDWLETNREHLLDLDWMLSRGNAKSVRDAAKRAMSDCANAALCDPAHGDAGKPKTL